MRESVQSTTIRPGLAGFRRRTRQVGFRAVATAVAIVGVLALSGCGSKADSIAASELAGQPTMVVVWADAAQARAAAAGDLYLVDAERKAATPLATWHPTDFSGDYDYGVYSAGWSPDRRSIGVSLAVWLGDPSSQIAVIDAKRGKVVRRLTAGYDSHFAGWTRDGRRIAYGTGLWSATAPALRSVPAAGGASVPVAPRVVARLRARGGREFFPSRNGSKVAALGRDRLLVTGRTSAVVTVARGVFGTPHWSPDGSSILYTRDEQRSDGDDTAYDVHVVGWDGSNDRRLTSDGVSGAAGWSPDGRLILITHEAVDEARLAHKPAKIDKKDWELYKPWTELWTADADGGRLTRLPFNRPHRTVIAADW